MEIRYETHQSRYLNRKMEYKIYGSKGLPCILLPDENGRFYDWEEKGGLADAAGRWIDAEKLVVFFPDSIDAETFCSAGEERTRAEQHERWICYLTEEFLPCVQKACKNSAAAPLIAGCGLGAAHAVNLFLRRPELFCGVIGLGGLFDTGRFFAKTADDLVFRNSPLLTLASLPAADNRIAAWRKASPFVLCCGQGDADALQDTRKLADTLKKLEVPVWFDEWGTDVTHDWYWWNKQLNYFMEKAVFAE